MHLLKQLNEQADEQASVKELMIAIMHAAPFFKQRDTNDQWLYRGMHHSLIPDGSLANLITPHSNRKPKDMDKYSSAFLDDALKRNFGIPYRSTGVFVSGSKDEASIYGKLGLVLPQGDFKFCWGRYVDDAYHTITINMAARYMKDLAKQEGISVPYLDNLTSRVVARDFFHFMETDPSAKILFAQWIDRAVEDGQYTDRNLSEAIASKNEIMLSCRQYAAIPLQSNIPLSCVRAAENLIKDDLNISGEINTLNFINALSKKVIPILNHG